MSVIKDPDLDSHHLGVIVTKQIMREVEKSAKLNYRTASMQARLVIELWLREACGVKLKTPPCKPIYEDIKINWAEVNDFQ
jgi:hypothetical protein